MPTAIPPAAASAAVAGAAHSSGAVETRTTRRSRRAQRRTPYRVPCRVKWIDADGAIRSLVGQTVNVSRGGLALQVGVDIPIGSWVEALVPHAHGSPLYVSGAVVHRRRVLAGAFEIGIAIGPDDTVQPM